MIASWRVLEKGRRRKKGNRRIDERFSSLLDRMGVCLGWCSDWSKDKMIEEKFLSHTPTENAFR